MSLKKDIQELLRNIQHGSPSCQKNVVRNCICNGCLTNRIESVINSDVRKRFETWYEADAMPLESNWFALDKDGNYKHNDTCCTWEIWQAAVKDTIE